MEKGYQLEFFMEQNERHEKKALYEWLIDVAKDHGVTGATAFTGSLGFGAHRNLHSAHFFELLDQPIQVTMIATEEESEKFLNFLATQKVDLFYAKIPAFFGRLSKA
ncbi:hypothetical protein BN59_03169 [Legionella massiliensis]|uniref:Uncharacterized protein n=1 Tax=Legionella massiliensis TaxID=1034943 RepID=A0A078KWL6_9GAMM|nr:DUF190 domain-containing protein [Legionella massiliensis]CDZ78855.1 hypothetical protein BN59_03169 [Legionella massiliensis]CEE14593.1 hypothetical protein BN1094_03169 [Legionella massiliensis]